MLRAADIAVAFRGRHARDAVIHFVCYRRNGHNELDEPRFTQPKLYQSVDGRPSIGQRYAKRLSAEGLISATDSTLSQEQCRERLQTAYASADNHRTNRSGLSDGAWLKNRTTLETPEADTGVHPDRLRQLLAQLAAVPEGMSIHPRLAQIVSRRAQVDKGVPWPTAEALAFATLLTEGVPVRISGQDVVRGALPRKPEDDQSALLIAAGKRGLAERRASYARANPARTRLAGSATRKAALWLQLKRRGENTSLALSRNGSAFPDESRLTRPRLFGLSKTGIFPLRSFGREEESFLKTSTVPRAWIHDEEAEGRV